MGAVGWKLSGIEYDAEAAQRARKTGAHVFVGDPLEAPFPEGAFDLVTAFHSLEHMPVEALVTRAGGVVERAEHASKARYFLRSLRHRLSDAGDNALARVLDSRVGGGVVKLGVEFLSPVAEWSRRGEAVRYFIRRASPAGL
jgi:hypothetical protein